MFTLYYIGVVSPEKRCGKTTLLELLGLLHRHHHATQDARREVRAAASPDGTDYRKRCADFVQEHRDAIAQARPEIPVSLNDRAADIWEPLLAIADLAGGEWPALARQAAESLVPPTTTPR